MSEADLTGRIEGIRQLGSVVRAMTGIAGARARTARSQIQAVEAYSQSVVRALMLVASEKRGVSIAEAGHRPALVVFCAEQGFVGGFSQRVLDAATEDLSGSDLFLVGSRGMTIAAEREMAPIWSASMPSRSASLPKFADRLLSAVMAQGERRTLTVVHMLWDRGQPVVERHVLLPTAPVDVPDTAGSPIVNLPAADLRAALGLDRLHALMTRTALHAFVAENEARMAAMSAATREIEDELVELEAMARRARQEAITSEIIEISAGSMAAR